MDDLQIGRVDDWLSAAPEVWMTGPAVKAFVERIPSKCRLVSEPDREPSIASVWQAGRGRAPLSREEIFALEPLYLRGSSAEEKAKTEDEPRR